MTLRRLLVRLALPSLVPVAAVWVERQQRRILAEGLPLSPAQLTDARALGVSQPERVRVLALPRIPLPGHQWVRRLGLWTGTLSTETIGMAMGQGIFLRTPFQHDRRLLAHELTHIRQYERLGGIRPFLRQYLWECLVDGYYSAPLEVEANTAANTLCG